MKGPPHHQYFKNRRDAGRRLAPLLMKYSGDVNAVILALPRGGVPVAAEIGKALHKSIDVLLVRKLGVPGRKELAMGAIAAGGVRVLNAAMISDLNLSTAELSEAIRRETEALKRREELYRDDRPLPDPAGKTMILVDDGIATGSTVSAAIKLLRLQKAARIVVAVPVGPETAINRLREEADEVQCLLEPQPFIAVSRWYDDFSPTDDTEARSILTRQPAETEDGLGKFPTLPSCGSEPDAIRHHAQPLTGATNDHDGLIDMMGDARVVLLGAPSHGSQEVHRERARITKRLILEKGFNAVAADVDWSDACRVNRFVRGHADGTGGLPGFTGFPSWTWRNTDTLDFIKWLGDHNESRPCRHQQAGFYGMDLFSLHKSMGEVIKFLDHRDPAAAARARALYGCTDRFGRDPQNYGLLAGAGLSDSCRAEVIRHLSALRAKEAAALSRDPRDDEECFLAGQNACLAKNAGAYYRNMFRSYVSSWNLRDSHMMEWLMKLIAYLESATSSAKVVVWAHNSHVGDARATEMSWHGDLNIAQLVRETFGDQGRLVGFTTHSGTVTSTSGWHMPAESKAMLPAADRSVERLFHQTGIPNFWLDLRHENAATNTLRKPRLERAIGVVYKPEIDRHGHYFQARVAEQFDALVHLDLTHALMPPGRRSGVKSAVPQDTLVVPS